MNYCLKTHQNTQHLHKVELARVTCEKERRHREKEARLEKQRLMEADRNKAALDRFISPNSIKVGPIPSNLVDPPNSIKFG